MDILFWLEPMAELHSPFLMKTWHKWFACIDQQLATALTNYRSAIIAFESMRFYEGHENFRKSVMLSHSDLRSNWSEKGNLSLKYEKDLSHSNEIELVDLIRRRTEGLSPDAVILLSEAPWLRRTFPDALFINIEVSWIHRDPFPTLYSLDPVGKGKGRVLARYADELLSNFEVNDNERNIVNQICGPAVKKLAANQRAKESIHAIRRNFKRVVLLPISGRYVTDGETPVFAALEWFFERRADDRTCYVITQHPLEKALSDSETAFLKAKFGNLSMDLQEIGSQCIIPHVDAVIGDFSSVANQVLFFKNEMVSIRHELPYVDDSFGMRNPLCRLIARANTETKEKILCWLLTKYDTKKENVFNNGKWFAAFLEVMKHFKETDSISKFYQTFTPENCCVYPRSLPNANQITCHKTGSNNMGGAGIKAIAFYLPQYHPIPENDTWWGKGFTEWTNVTKAEPLFEGHYQPHRPADLGFYDLRVAEVRKAQADLAKAYGIFGFCYYHYWFGGKLILERPLQEMLRSENPDFPFCLCWANENWTRTWDGGDQHILIAQNYSEDDDLQHIRYLSRIFRDPRYIRIHDKPLFLVYRANLLPNPMRTTVLWREEAKRLGVGELYLCRVESFRDEHTDPAAIGFDAAVEFQPDWTLLSEDLRDRRVPNLRAYHYEKVVDRMLAKPLSGYQRFQCVTPSWDNTPRRNSHSLFFTENSPAHYERWLTGACSKLGATKAEERLVFINAWNEWGEGNHLEPDEKFGHGYLEATRSSIETAKQNLRKEAIVFHERIRSEILPEGKLQNTLDRLMELVVFHPDYAPAYLDLGALFKQAGDTRNALAAYEKACALEPLNASCLRCLADFYFVELKRNEDAEALYEKIVSLSPEDEEALLMLGNLSTIQRRFEKALQAFLKVLVRNPAHEFAGKMFDELAAKIKEKSIVSSPDLLLEDARVLAQRGRSDQAIYTLEKLLSAFPDHAIAHNDLGFLHYRKGEVEKALAHYEKAISIDRKNPTVLKNLADFYLIELKQTEEALKLYTLVLQEHPRDTEALKAIGSICIQLERYEDALEIFLKIQEMDPSDAEAAGILKSLLSIDDAVNPDGSDRTRPDHHRIQLKDENATVPGSVHADSVATTLNTFEIKRIESFDDYAQYTDAMREVFKQRMQEEQNVIGEKEFFTVPGTCAICKREVEFHVDYFAASVKENGRRIPNWRERLGCPGCGLINRCRAVIHIIEKILSPSAESKIFIAEQTTPVYQWLSKRYPHTVGSEFLGRAIPLGSKRPDGIRNEDLTALTFPDGSFDCVMTNDVFEHIPDYQKAFNECQRVLKPGGVMLFTAPFNSNSRQTVIRARHNSDGTVEHLSPPEYHGDPLNRFKGCLCYQVFGWDMIEQLKRAGFDDSAAYFYWSRHLGYLGNNQMIFIAKKKELPNSLPVRDGGEMHSQSKNDIVSIIIPVFNKLSYTRNCLKAIERNTPAGMYEIIVVDNASSDGTRDYLASLEKAVTVRTNIENVGFTKACNQGARIAKGKYICFLNNDAEPEPGWLENMVGLAESDDSIGIVGSKLVYPDRRLQEAGGIVFSDGSGWNYGRFGDPDDPSFNYVREVDYVSGASLLIRHDLLKKLNYFDERYSPGYYEDTDLCFGARSLGYKVIYCPFSVVVHHEGVSSGNDLKQGMKKFQVINREKFQAKWEIVLHSQHPADSKNVIPASERGVSGNILIIDPFLPMFDRASGSLRLFTIVSLLRKQGYHITFIARNGQEQESYSAVLRKMGVEVYATDGDMLRQMGYAVHARPFDFNQILRTRCYQLAILSFYDIAEQYLPMIRSASPETRILIDTVDIHFVREMRQAEINGDSAALKRADATKERELAIYAEADGVITVTERDWDHIRASLPSKPHFVIPNIHPVGGSSIGLNGRKGLLFIGNFNHTPNTDAMLYFVAEVFPIVRRTLPELTLTIVGNNPPKEVRALASRSILVTGYVPSTAPYLKTARVSIAPLRYGAGMKGKIGEAMAHGLPVVTTSIGAEGMGLVSGRDALIAESPQEFADHIIALCTNDEAWRSIASAARQLVYDSCSPEKVDLMIAGMINRVALIPPLKGTPFRSGFQAGPNKSITKDLTSIVILTFNQLQYTKECIQSIQQYTPEPHEIIFIDNGSNDGTVKWLKRLVEQHSNYRLIENDSNLGFSKGCNQGIEASTGDHVVLINNDVVVTKDWLSGLMECLHSAADIGIVGPMTNNISGPQKVPHVDYSSVADLHGYASVFRTKNRYRRISNRRVVGFCMLFKRRLIDEIGRLDESFGSGNYEDDDLCLRACLGGYRNLIAGDVFIHHYGSRTFVGNKMSYGSSLSRNRKVFQDKWRQPDILKRFGKRLIIQKGIFQAEEYFRKDDLEKATASILDAIQQAPGERQLYIQLAQMLIEKKRFDDALGILASLPENNFDSRQYALMGYCHEALGNDRSAEDYADQALANLPASALALNVKGVLAFKRNDKAAAEAWFRRAIESDPCFGESYTNLGSLKWEAGEQKEALDAFERGFILSPTIDDVATAYHTAVVETKSFEKAEAVLHEAKALYPNHKRLAFLMIALLLEQEKVDPAMAEIEKAMLQYGIDDGILSAGLEVRKRIGALQVDKSKCKRATLSLCMIVKNEEPHLAKCLMSVKPVVDEMIVVDTGSSDRSKDIAAALGARVFEYPWTNDFSEARNYSLSQASGDWIFVLDADEVISTLDHGLLQKITRKRPAKHHAYILITRNYTNNPGARGWVANEGRYIEEEAGAGWVPSPKVRLFINDQRIRFVNPVHELVEPTLAKLGIPIRTCDVPVHHYGRLNQGKLMAKGKEYYRLGIAKIEQTQGDCSALKELAIQASEIGEYEEAVGVWQKVIERQPNDAVAHMNLGFAFLMMRQHAKAVESSKKAMAIDPELREAALNYSAASMFAGDIRTAISTLEHLLERHADYPPAMGRLAAAYIVSGRKADGLRCLEKLNSRGFDCAGACEEQARAFLSESKHEAAALLLTAAIEKGIGNGRLSHLLAECRSRIDGDLPLCEPPALSPAHSTQKSREPVENRAGV